MRRGSRPANTPQIKGCNGREEDLIHRMNAPSGPVWQGPSLSARNPLAGPSLLGPANHSPLRNDSNREYEGHVEISGHQLCLDSRTRVDLRKCPYLLLRKNANELMKDGCEGCD